MTISRRALEDALTHLETTVGVAVVAGEVDVWCHDLLGSCARLDDVLVGQREYYEQEFKAILDADMELSARVDQLRSGERKQWDRLAELKLCTAELLREQEKAPASSSGEPLDRAQDLRRKFLAWIVDVRAHDQEMLTWILESDYRDRGVAD